MDFLCRLSNSCKSWLVLSFARKQERIIKVTFLTNMFISGNSFYLPPTCKLKTCFAWKNRIVLLFTIASRIRLIFVSILNWPLATFHVNAIVLFYSFLTNHQMEHIQQMLLLLNPYSMCILTITFKQFIHNSWFWFNLFLLKKLFK